MIGETFMHLMVKTVSRESQDL